MNLKHIMPHNCAHSLVKVLSIMVLLACATTQLATADDYPTIKPAIELRHAKAIDQDDMCFWTHPSDASLSLVIASDKKGNGLFAYDLDGKMVQTIPLTKPGNIDIRQGVVLGGKTLDVVAVNLRKEQGIALFSVNAATRLLERIDDGRITTGSNYGGTLYLSPKSRKLYFVCTSEKRQVEQFEIKDNGQDRVSGTRVRHWDLGKCEGAVGDDELGKIYITEEGAGVWELGGEPEDPAPGKLVIKLGDHALQKDLEGIAIYKAAGGTGYLIVSSQGANLFYVFERQGAHRYIGAFRIEGAQTTDGIDVISTAWNPKFGHGLFACHTDINGRPVLLTDWQKIANSFTPALTVAPNAIGR